MSGPLVLGKLLFKAGFRLWYDEDITFRFRKLGMKSRSQNMETDLEEIWISSLFVQEWLGFSALEFTSKGCRCIRRGHVFTSDSGRCVHHGRVHRHLPSSPSLPNPSPSTYLGFNLLRWVFRKSLEFLVFSRPGSSFSILVRKWVSDTVEFQEHLRLYSI